MIKDEKLLKQVRTKPCVVCGFGDWDMDSGEWRNQSHHIKAKGMGSGKRLDTEANIASICQKDHLELHSYPKTFIERHGEELYRLLRGQS